MLAPILLMPRADDIATPTAVSQCYLWVEETPTTLASWEPAEEEAG